MDTENFALRLATAPEDDELVQLLAKAQVGKRMVHIARLTARESAEYALLSRVQAVAPDVFRTLLRDPATGPSLRRGIGPLVAAAAIAAGIPAVVDVASHDGEVMLPTLGAVVLPRAAERATIRVEVVEGRSAVSVVAAGEMINLPEDLAVETESWRPVTRITAGAVAPLDITLSTDRLLGDVYGAPEDFDDRSIHEWRQAIESGWRLLETERPGHAAAIAAGLRTIVPVPRHADGNMASCTIEGAFGAVFMSFPETPELLAVTLVHEFQHAKLSAALDIAPMYTAGDEAVHYAPWRDDPRPLAALLQGIYAHLGVAQFWGTHRSAATERVLFAQVQFARWRADTRQACQGILGDSALTEAGRIFVEALAAELDRLCAEPVPAEAAETADRMALGHAVSWRLRNLEIDPAAARKLAEAWVSDARPNLPSVDEIVRPARRPRDIGGIRTASRHRTPADSSQPNADELCALGRYEGALVAYQKRIVSAPDDLDSWVGCALSVRPDDPARHALRAVPEVVAESYRQATLLGTVAAEPIDLARWLARAL